LPASFLKVFHLVEKLNGENTDRHSMVIYETHCSYRISNIIKSEIRRVEIRNVYKILENFI